VKTLKPVVLLLIFVAPALLCAWANYKTVGTPNFEVYYRQGWQTEAENILQALEYSRPYVQKLTGGYPGKVPVVLSDMGNYVNGYASPVVGKIGLYAYPPSTDDLSLDEDWWQLVGIHEYIHMAQMTRSEGEPALLRMLFGNILYPNLYQPMWMTEGITVYGESQLSPYTGRLNAGTYPAIIHALAREGRLPNPGKAGYYSYSNPLANYYVYGSSFHEYLARQYGEEKFPILYGTQSSTLSAYLNPIASAFSLDKAYNTAYGKDVATLWTEWQADAARNSSPLPQQRLTEDGWSKENLKYYKGALYYQQRKTDKTGPSSAFSSYRLVRLEENGGKAHTFTVVEQNSDFPAGYQIDGDKLYFSRSEYKPGYANNDADGYGVITEVWEQNLGGGERRKLFSGAIRAFCHLEEDHFLISEDDATHQKSMIYEVTASSGKKNLLGTLDALIGTIDLNEGVFYVTARSFWNNNSIFILDTAKMLLEPLVYSPNQETVVSVSGNDLIFNACYSGQNGCYLYKLDSGEMFQYSGYAEQKNVVISPEGKNWFLSINGDGYDIYSDELKLRPVKPSDEMGMKQPYVRLDASKKNLIMNTYPVQHGSYLKNIGYLLWPRLYRFPYIGTSNENALQDSLIAIEDLVLGVQVAGADVTGDFPMWNAALLYDVGKNSWGWNVGLENNFFAPVKHTIEFEDMPDTLVIGGVRQRSKVLSSVQYFPFLQRMNYGLTSAYAGFGVTTSGNFDRKLWYPFLGMNFTGPGIRLQTTNTMMIETQKFWASDRSRLGWQGNLNLKLKLPLSAEFRSNILAAYDPQANTNEVFSMLRGYDQTNEDGSENTWRENRGVVFSNTVYAPIIKVRNGLWNPNVYLEDINLGVFGDYAYPWDKDAAQIRYSYGLEVIAEIMAGYNYGLDLGVRFGWNREGKSTFSFILGI
jgi:hypothetical protein